MPNSTRFDLFHDIQRKRLFQPDTDSLAQRQQDAARIAELNREIQRKTILGRILAVYVWITEVVFVVLRTIQLCLYFLPLVISGPIARYNKWFRIKIWYEMLVRVLERSGPIFVKMGQWASTRRDIFSDELCEALSLLQRYAKTHPWSHTQKTLEASLGPLWYLKFEEFELQRVRAPLVAGKRRQKGSARTTMEQEAPPCTLKLQTRSPIFPLDELLYGSFGSLLPPSSTLGPHV